MTTPRIAFVIPAYNAAGSIAAAVRSAREQVVPADEIIVVDDGSLDDTAGLAASAGARVITRVNGGPGAARNTGIQATSAEWIALLDADDIAQPDRIRLERPHVNDPRTAVIHAGFWIPASPPMEAPPPLDFSVLWERNWVCTSTVLLRREAWESAGGFDESPSLIGVEDYNLWLRLAHAGWSFTYVEDVLADYRPGLTSLSVQWERFANAELSNIMRVANRLRLSKEMLRLKEFQLYSDYGVELFHRGKRLAARDFFREARTRGQLSWRSRLRLWAATVGLPSLKRSPAAGN